MSMEIKKQEAHLENNMISDIFALVNKLFVGFNMFAKYNPVMIETLGLLGCLILVELYLQIR